jgi:alkylation response protein AidB-like acyl-CoA dehydrogenase
MADLEAFRAEVAGWLEANAPEALRGKRKDPLAETNGGKKWKFHYPESKAWLDMMAAKGWTAPTWPEECGGAGLSDAEAHVIREEVARLDLPPPLTGQNFGLYMIGAMMVQRASDEQKREHLPKIAAGQIRWCQGYSEPNAGSDLAAVQMTAVRDGDEYVLNGQKLWTSYGDESDWMFLIARTDPEAKKQEGITFFLLDLETPGVEIRPIKLISGASPFCETFLDDCRVPARNVVGGLNDGWTIAKALLEHERKMISGAGGEAMGGVAVNPTMLMHRYLGVREDGKIADPILRDQITQLSFDGLCYILTTARARDEAQAGQSPGPLSSMFKVYGTELNQRMEEMDMKIRGPQALGWEGEGFEEDELRGTRSWLRSRGNSIEGGTSEIQRNIIAKRVLDLPEA